MGAQLGWEVPEEGWRKGPWTAEEDRLLIEYVSLHGEGKWNSVARLAGLKRNGKSCRLRWVNYLRPDLKRGRITPHEENIILELHARWGNRWSTIAQKLPGRTDNEIKNYWRTHFKKKAEKVSSKDQTEKSKARLLRRQQFHNQQQLQLQQQQLQENQQVATRRFMTALLDESENINKVPSLAHQVFYPNSSTTTTTYEDHCMLSSMFNMPPSSSAADYICVEDQMLWSGLWNMDYIDASLDDINGAGRCNQ